MWQLLLIQRRPSSLFWRAFCGIETFGRNEPAESEKGAVVYDRSFQSMSAGLEDVLCCLMSNTFQLNDMSLSHSHGYVPKMKTISRRVLLKGFQYLISFSYRFN